MTLFTPPHLLDGQRWRGMRVGLLGGSFNPPHAGHLHISSVALKRLSLDCVWWLVTPQNPLKQSSESLDYQDRLARCRMMAHGQPRIIVSDLERQTGTTRTVETLGYLNRAFPSTSFVFLCGTDLLAQLPRWHRWKTLPRLCAMAFIARPPAADLVRHAGIRALFSEVKILSGTTGEPLLPGKGFWITGEKLHPESSTNLRKSIQNK